MKKESRTTAPRILVVDDHHISRQFTVAALRQNAADVKQARTVSEALELACNWLPEVILMDIRLGDANGFDVVRQIRKCWSRPIKPPRIFMLTAEPPQPGQTQASRDSIDGILLKPLKPEMLLHAVWPQHQTTFPRPVEPPEPRLQGLFRDELGARLGRLDRCLTRPDLVGARAILHQLIASSGLCRQRRLERDLRALHSSCCKKPRPADLAREYYALLTSARAYLQPATAERRD